MNNRPLNILLLPRWYPNRMDPQLGVFIQKHARAIATMHNIVVFYALPDERMVGSNIESEFLITDHVHEYKYYFRKDRSLFRPIVNTLRYLACWIKFSKQVRLYRNDGTRPDIIHAYIVLRTALIARLLRILHGTPFVLSEQWSGYVTDRFQRLNPIKRRLIRNSIKRADAVTAVSNFLSNSIRRLTQRKDIGIIYNIIETEYQTPLAISHDGVVIAMVADLVDDIKNISAVLRCMGSLKKSHPEVTLRLIGGGPDEALLKSLAQKLEVLDETVFFEGRKDNASVYELLQRCDFLVMNSRFETFSLICAEALSCGKPVIATRCGGPEEIINEDNGILIDVEDEAALLSSLQNMITGFRKFDAGKIREAALSKYGRATAAAGFDAVYRQLLRSSR